VQSLKGYTPLYDLLNTGYEFDGLFNMFSVTRVKWFSAHFRSLNDFALIGINPYIAIPEILVEIT
jgi:hypothetical protein